MLQVKKNCVYVRTRFSRTQILLLEKNIDCIGIDSSRLLLTFVAFCLLSVIRKAIAETI